MTGRPLTGFVEQAIDYSDEWYTPSWVLDSLGEFDLDPCSPLRRPFDTAKRHLTVEDDGLNAEWSGRIWLNPPYSDVDSWVRKMAHHNYGTALVFARVETALWQDVIWPTASAVLFPRGRVGFINGRAVPSRQLIQGQRSPGDTSGGPAAPSALIAWGEHDAQRLRLASIAGAYVEPMDRP